MSQSLIVSRPQESASTSSKSRRGRRRIVVVGGGFGGIAAAKALRLCDAEVIVIDRRNAHIFQPLLYQVATAVLATSEVAAPIRQLEAKQQNVFESDGLRASGTIPNAWHQRAATRVGR